VWRVPPDSPDLWLHEAFASRPPRPSRFGGLIAIAQLLVLPAAFFTILDEVPDVRSRVVGIGWLSLFMGCYWWLPMKILAPTANWDWKLPKNVHGVYFGGVRCPAAIDIWLSGATPGAVLAATVREMDTRPSKCVSCIFAVAAVAPAALASPAIPGGALAALPYLAFAFFAFLAFLDGFKTLSLVDQCHDMALLWNSLATGASRRKWNVRYYGMGIVISVVLMVVVAASVQLYANWMIEALRAPAWELLGKTVIFALMAFGLAHAFHSLARRRYRKALALAAEHFDDAHRRLASMQPAAR